MTWYSLCRGADLPICANCRRLADHHPDASRNPYQPYINPTTLGERCAQWMAKPAAIKTPTSA